VKKFIIALVAVFLVQTVLALDTPRTDNQIAGVWEGIASVGLYKNSPQNFIVNAGLIFPLLSGEIFPVLSKNIIRSQRLRLSSVPSFCRNRPASSVCGSDAAACRA